MAKPRKAAAPSPDSAPDAAGLAAIEADAAEAGGDADTSAASVSPTAAAASPFTADEAAARLGVSVKALAVIAERVGVTPQEVFGFRESGAQLVVVTVAGQKLFDPAVAE